MRVIKTVQFNSRTGKHIRLESPETNLYVCAQGWCHGDTAKWGEVGNEWYFSVNVARSIGAVYGEKKKFGPSPYIKPTACDSCELLIQMKFQEYNIKEYLQDWTSKNFLKLDTGLAKKK